METFDINNIQLNLQSPGLTLEPFLKEHLIEQIEKLGKTFSRIIGCEMLLKEEKNDNGKRSFIECKLIIPGHILFSSRKDENFRLAAAALFDDLQDQLIRTKEKMQDKTPKDNNGI